MSAHKHVQLQCNIFHIFPKDDKLSCKGHLHHSVKPTSQNTKLSYSISTLLIWTQLLDLIVDRGKEKVTWNMAHSSHRTQCNKIHKIIRNLSNVGPFDPYVHTWDRLYALQSLDWTVQLIIAYPSSPCMYFISINTFAYNISIFMSLLMHTTPAINMIY